MKINVKTRFNELTTIYDSTEKPENYTLTKKIIAPYIEIEENGYIIYRYGNPNIEVITPYIIGAITLYIVWKIAVK